MNKELLLLLVLLSVSGALTGEFDGLLKMLSARGKAKTSKSKALPKKQWETAKKRSDAHLRSLTNLLSSLKNTKKKFEAIVEDKKLNNKQRNKKLSELKKKNPTITRHLELLSMSCCERCNAERPPWTKECREKRRIDAFRMYAVMISSYFDQKSKKRKAGQKIQPQKKVPAGQGAKKIFSTWPWFVIPTWYPYTNYYNPYMRRRNVVYPLRARSNMRYYGRMRSFYWSPVAYRILGRK